MVGRLPNLVLTPAGRARRIRVGKRSPRSAGPVARGRGMRFWAAWLLGAAMPAVAQTVSADPQPHVAATATVDPDDPFVVQIAYTGEVWRAASGGIGRGTRYLDNLDLTATADLEALIGWRGATAFAYGLYNNGSSISELVGDAQTVSNIEVGTRAVRLYEAWFEQRLAGDRASLKVGRYDLSSEFDVLESGLLFVHSAHGIGTEIAATGRNGPSTFPFLSLGARLAVVPTDGWTLRAAVLDGVPDDPARPKRTAVKLSGRDGAFLIGEVERSLPGGKLLIGYWRYSARFDRLDGSRGRGNDGVYVRAEHHLTREPDADQGLAGFVRAGVADGRINMFDRYLGAGLTYTGAIPGRDEDQLGVAMAAAFTSKSYRLTIPATRQEVALELTYRAGLTDFLSLQPGLHYVIDPGADPSSRDALAPMLRAEVSVAF